MTEQDYQLIRAEVQVLARKLKLSKDVAEDFLQDVLVKLLEVKPEYVNTGYLRLLFQRMIADRYRKEMRRPKVVYSSELADGLLEKKGDL